jgi:hypothetical protein
MTENPTATHFDDLKSTNVVEQLRQTARLLFRERRAFAAWRPPFVIQNAKCIGPNAFFGFAIECRR